MARRVGSGRVERLAADLSDLADVRRLAEDVRARHDAVHLLVNNAGATFREHSVTGEGVERHVAVNHLAGFCLTTMLLDRLRAGAPSRVVNVVSATMADTRRLPVRRTPRPVRLDPAQLDDLTRLNPAAGYAQFEAYARAKLLTVMWGYRLAEQLGGSGVAVNAVHPGVAATGITADALPAAMAPLAGALRRLLLTPEEGARAVLRVATDPDLDGVTGRYFLRDEQARSPEVSYDPGLQRRLWDASAALAQGRTVA
nr:SDR family NAD(P)-dependent oxidoreductase [Pseudonocardia lacus]